MSASHRFDVAALAAITQQWVTAMNCDDTDEARRLATQAIDSLLGTFHGGPFPHAASPTLHPGIYYTQPQGHVLIVDATHDTTVVNMGSAISIAGVGITDWDALAELGHHLILLADRQRTTSTTRP